jgi:sulfur carrier protein
MEITINNQLHVIKQEDTLLDIVFAQVGEKQKGIAVALNGKVIPKQNWPTTPLNLNDILLIIKATQGG